MPPVLVDSQAELDSLVELLHQVLPLMLMMDQKLKKLIKRFNIKFFTKFNDWLILLSCLYTMLIKSKLDTLLSFPVYF
jgi:hypothetical protein